MKIKEAIRILREKVITLLGGTTKERCGIENSVMYTNGKFRAAEAILNRMEELYGVPADEWCKEMYKFTSDMYESNDRIIQKYNLFIPQCLRSLRYHPAESACTENQQTFHYVFPQIVFYFILF